MVLPRHCGPLDLEVEHCRPDEGEHAAGEATDEAHEDGEVRDDDGEHDGHDHHAHAEPQAPNLQLTVQGPDRGENGHWFALKKNI